MAKISAEIEVVSTGDGFAQATGQAKQFRGAMDDLGKSGFMAVEKLEQKTFDLQSALIAQRKQLLSVREAQAQYNAEINKAGFGTLAQGEALKKLNAQEIQLQKTLSLSAAGYKNARQELGNMGARMRDASGDAMLMTSMLGTRLPMSMNILLMRSAAVQRAIGAMLPVGLVAAAAAGISVGLMTAYVHMDILRDKWTLMVETVRRYGLVQAIGEETGIGGLLGKVGIITEPQRVAIEQRRKIAMAEQSEARARDIRNQTALMGLGGLRKIGEEERQAGVAYGVARNPAEVAAMEKFYAAQRTDVLRQYSIEVQKQTQDVSRAWLGEVDALRQAAEDEIAIKERLADKTHLFYDAEKDAIRGRANFAIAQRNRQLDFELEALGEQAAMAGIPSQYQAGRAGIQAEIRAYERARAGPQGQISPEDFERIAEFSRAKYTQFEAQQAELRRRAGLETIGIQEQAGVAALPAWMRPMGQIAAEERRQLRELDELRRGDLIGAEDYERRRAAYTIMAEQQRIEAVRSFGRELESMYDRTIGSAKTFGEAMKNIWGEVMNYWRRQAFDTLSAILLGARTSPSAPGGTMGGTGGLGGLGGVILGLPGGGVGGITTPTWNPNPFMGGFLSTQGAPYSTAPIGAASWPIDMTPDLGPYGRAGTAGGGAGGSSAATNRGGLLGEIMARARSTKVGPLSAASWMQLGALTMAATYGHGRIVSTAGGAVGGAMTGMAIGSMIMPGIGTAIGAAAGFIAGGIYGWFGGGSGKKKTDASAIADQGFAEIFRQIDDYRHWRRDYASTLAAMNTTWGGMRDQWRGIWGGYGNSSERDQRRWYDAAVAQVTGIEQARQNRRAVLGGGLAPTLPLPEFQSGGYVSGAPGQPQLIVAHGGERVQTPAQAWSSPEEPAPVTATRATSAQIVKVLIEDPAALDRGMLVWLQRRGRAARAITQ